MGWRRSKNPSPVRGGREGRRPDGLPLPPSDYIAFMAAAMDFTSALSALIM